MVHVFKNVGERYTAKLSPYHNYHSVSLLSVVGKVFEKLNRIIDHLEKCGLFF